jgi:Zn-dependent peptidase ImmA (M78 family)
MQDFSTPLPTGLFKTDVWALAEEAAERLGFQIGDPLEPIVEALGGTIVFKDPVTLEGRLPESIVVRSRKDFTIFLASITSSKRDRFTIAHELGHLFLHYPIALKSHPGLPMVATRWVGEGDAVHQRSEWEANWFAAAFLMPSEKFVLYYEDHAPAQCAKKFDVSLPAVENRAKSLGLKIPA